MPVNLRGRGVTISQVGYRYLSYVHRSILCKNNVVGTKLSVCRLRYMYGVIPYTHPK